MRSINTNSISGPQAIVVAAMGWWIQEAGLREEVSKWALSQDPTRFLDRTDEVVGHTVMDLFPRNLFAEMLVGLSLCSATRYMLDMATSQGGGKDYLEEFLKGQFSNELALIFKATGFFERHKKEIAAAKAKHKTIRKVIES